MSRFTVCSALRSQEVVAYNFPKCQRCSEHLVEETGADEGLTPLFLCKGAPENLIAEPGTLKWASAVKFKGKSGEILLLPDLEKPAGLSKVVIGVDDENDVWGSAAIAKLPAGAYRAHISTFGESTFRLFRSVALGFMLGHYCFSRYKKKKIPRSRESQDFEELTVREKARLVWPTSDASARAEVLALAQAIYLARDLITTPAEDLGPQHLAAEATALARAHQGASITVIEGEELLQQNYPAIHTVGRASSRQPLLIDLRWSPPAIAGDERGDLPLVCLVGKGVCFDTGGLDIKPASSMKLMKKDMGGAALLLALSHVIMDQALPVRLRLLIPAVENSISGNAFRPLDVLQTRAGITVENGNTDAEGRLILCDALTEAAADSPDLLVDAATLTGAARTALGSEIPAVFSSCDQLWSELQDAALEEGEMLWRLPLYKGYRKMLESKVADMASTGGEGSPGAIVAALFLQEFVKHVPRWLHIDTGAYNKSSKEGRPEGGEAQGLRALWAFLKRRYQKKVKEGSSKRV
ncbi:hypothetical protein CEUSTIGMA_g2323.t1 [Chlamydomonas eustigma]|uniref:Cytosol aminopeptidase domain-containing protein n=1 Tax=Chlamydomonas eustigma TaxID=1157962 RepID=A0A250WVL9_9CHLO|nr:hypothetical protein CEUSTIGMA_g2323.t1 [Chlamydomonas eustigma]|eukprot:GAX74877.1 hypothetical protein CEUSTIGMA_g2323.t1 [Chlamydomonas eustigma]